jgi:hypothetical protein
MIDSTIKGGSKSCGCIKINNLYKHGESLSKEYRVWHQMKQRCYNKKNKRYYRYGGRGIFVCEKWKNDFSAFLSDMGRRPSKEHSIDRKNNDFGYSPENCRWATRSQQQRNKTSYNSINLPKGDNHWTRKDIERAKRIFNNNMSKIDKRNEKNPNAKMTYKTANLMRSYFKKNNNITMQELGAFFGVKRETARKIIRGIAWK